MGKRMGRLILKGGAPTQARLNNGHAPNRGDPTRPDLLVLQSLRRVVEPARSSRLEPPQAHFSWPFIVFSRWNRSAIVSEGDALAKTSASVLLVPLRAPAIV